jgi:Fe-S cluster biogenesis protein NfuA
MKKEITMEEKIKAVLDEIRPALQRDGGDLEFIGVDEKGNVKIKLLGACHGCPFSTMTTKNGIERLLKQSVPEVTTVEAVD